MNGILFLPTSTGKLIYVTGGPFRDCPKGYFSVRLAKELTHLDASMVLPIKDFSVPSTKDVDEKLPVIIDAICKNKNVYIGCMGGWGRTGLMLVIIAKAWGIKDPIEYVRDVYSHKAVETKDQERFALTYRVKWKIRMRVWIRKYLGF